MKTSEKLQKWDVFLICES